MFFEVPTVHGQYGSKKPSGEVFWADVLQIFDDEQLHFHMSWCTFEYVLQLIKQALKREITHRHHSHSLAVFSLCSIPTLGSCGFRTSSRQGKV